MMRNFVFLSLMAFSGHSFLTVSRSAHKGATLRSSSNSCDVAIMGGGFGGLYAALAIARQAKQQGQSLDVVLVEPTETFVFLPLLYDLTVGTATEVEVCPSYRDLLAGTGVRQIRASLDSLCNQAQSAILRPATPQAPEEKLSFRAAVIAVGASPQSILAAVPGASELAQPFYTASDAKSTRRLLARLEERVRTGHIPRVAIVGGGFGGVELAASVRRKIPGATVVLLCRGPPMAGTRVEPLIERALAKLGVEVRQCSVDAIEVAPMIQADDTLRQPLIIIKTTKWSRDYVEERETNDDEPWDAVLWTAGSRPSFPVSGGLSGLRKTTSGRLAIDSSLRCYLSEELGSAPLVQPMMWALGDCAEIVSLDNDNQPAVPKTAQAAMQQADVVAYNLLAQLDSSKGKGGKIPARRFQFQDLGSMLTLGGPNAALMAPKEGGTWAPLLTPVIDTVGGALGLADRILEATVGKSTLAEKWGLTPELLGLSLGSYGILGGEGAAAPPGTLAGTLTGAARRAVYAARMPTNQQRALAATSAAISTAAALAKEVAARRKD